MPENWDELAAKGRAAHSAEQLRKEELRAQWEQLAGRRAARDAAWRLSPLAMQPFRFLTSMPALTVWLLTLAMAFPYFTYFVTGAPVHGSSKGTRWVLDPASEGYGLFYVFVASTALLITGLVWRWLTRRAGERRAAEEAAWSDTLPFPLVGFPNAVGAHDHRFKLEIYFVDRSPGASLAEVVRGVDSFMNDSSIGKRSRFDFDYPDGPPPLAAQRFVSTMHTLADAVLVPLHAQCPIERVEVRG